MPIPVIDTQEFRRKLAGFTDPNARPTGLAEKANIKDEAIRFGLIMCELFGSSLDRTTLWDRMGSAMVTASAKSIGGDIDQFVSLCLDHVKAEPGRAATHEGLQMFLQMATGVARDDAWRQAFIRMCGQNILTILPLVKVRWEQLKLERKNQPAQAMEGGAE